MREPVGEFDLRAPAERTQSRDIEQLARCAIGLRRVPDQLGGRIDHVGDRLGQLTDREVDAGPDVDVRVVRVVLHQEQAGGRQVVDMEELANGAPGAPHLDLVGVGLFGVVELADQGGDHVRRIEIEVVAGAVQVGGHRRDEVAAVLTAVGLAQLDPGDLGDRVPLVGALERTGQELLLGDRLGGVARVDARRTEIQQFAHSGLVGGVHDGAVDHQVVVDELGRPGAVGENPADRARDEEHVVGSIGLEPVRHLRLVAQVDLRPPGCEDVGEAFGFESADERRPDQPAVTGHVHPSVSIQLRHTRTLPTVRSVSGLSPNALPLMGLGSWPMSVGADLYPTGIRSGDRARSVTRACGALVWGDIGRGAAQEQIRRGDQR